MRLTSEVIIELGLLRAQIATMIEREKKLCDIIKDRMIELDVDEFRPQNCVNKFVFVEYDRANVDYEDMAKRAYRRIYGSGWKRQFQLDKDEYGMQHIMSLLIRPNEDYRNGKSNGMLQPKRKIKLRE